MRPLGDGSDRPAGTAGAIAGSEAGERSKILHTTRPAPLQFPILSQHYFRPSETVCR